MNRSLRWCNAVLISAALVAPGALVTRSFAKQDEERDEKVEKAAKAQKKADKEAKKVRVYDAKHKVYHDWTDVEDRAYRRYLEDKHEDYVEYQRLKAEQQADYWDWRAAHPDAP